MGGHLTSWPEPNSLSGSTPIDRGPDVGGRYQDLDGDEPDKHEELEIVMRE